MIKDTIAKIEATINHSPRLSPENRTKLQELVTTLKSELEALSQTDEESAQSIANFTHVSTHESLKEKKNEALESIASSGLETAIQSFNTSHPILYKTIDTITRTLSRLGI